MSFALPKKVVNRIIRLLKQGLPDRRVAKLLGLGKTTMRDYRKQFKLPANGHALRKSEANLIFIDAKAKCRRCEIPKSKSQFTQGRNVCKTCENERQKLHIHTNFLRYFSRKASSSRLWAEHRNIPFSINGQDLLDMYEYQNRKCFYTDRPMRPNAGLGNKRECVSIDRIVPHLGYVLPNIVLCTTQANLIKNDQTLEELKEWMPGWYARLKSRGL